MGFSSLLTPLVIIGILLAAFPKALELLTRHEYPIHDKGAILITGASTGIGRHAVETLAKEGKFVVYAGVRKPADAEDLASLKIPNLRPLLLDVSNEESVVRAHEEIVSELAEEGLPFVGLVNNAGLSTNAPVEFLPISKLRQLLEVNVIGSTRLTQLFIPQLRQGKGRVVNISSVLGKMYMGTRSAYCASKRAMEAVSDVLRVEMLPFNVSVSIVEPAYVASAIFGKIVKEVEDLVTDDAKAIYGDIFYRQDQSQRRASHVSMASPPTVTTDAIRHALEDPFPQTHYVVANMGGTPAWVPMFLNWLLPPRILDWALLNLF